jgi:hypothetical protein
MPWTGTTTRSTGFLVTAAVWNSELVDNMTFLEEVNYTEFTSNVSITATTEGTANQVVTSGAISYENVPHLIEFWCPAVTAGVAALRLGVFDGTTQVGLFTNSAANETSRAYKGEHRLIPTAASHTYNVRGYNASAATGTVAAGAGGTGVTLLPGFIRVTRIPT